MVKKSAEQLREDIRQESARLRGLVESRDKAAKLAREYGAEVRKVNAARDRHLISARRAGVSVAELAEDSGLTVGRIRQIAPTPTTAGAPRRPPTVTARVDDDDQEVTEVPIPAEMLAEADRQIARLAGGPGRAVSESVMSAVATAAAAGPATPQLGAPAIRRPRAAPPGGRVKLEPLAVYSIDERVDQALMVTGGDPAAAMAVLVAHAVPDAMTLLGQCRVGATYDHTAHPSTPPPLQRPDRKRPDLIWEGRPHWTHASTPPGTVVTRLDMNGAYLAALRRTHLPIGGLKADPPGTPFDRRRAGVYLVEVAPWTIDQLPSPLGSREAAGPVWLTDATLRLLLRVHAHLAASAQKWGTPVPVAPRVLESYTSGSSENLLSKFGDQLAAARAAAIEESDGTGTSRGDVKLEYVKKLYSKFVSTAGDSRANFELERPEWVHAIRSQAFANLWLKAQKAVEAGLIVHKMSGTDELHVAGDWEHAVWGGRLLFPQGRGLAEVKVKDEGGTYVVGANA